MKEKLKEGSILENINTYSILRDLLRSLWAILLGAAAVAMIVNMITHMRMESTYSTNATFVITSRTSGNYAINNLNAASTMATSCSNVLNSNLLRTKVCGDLGVSSFNATMSTKVITDTNLMTLKVTSDTPWNTYRITRSVMKNMEELTEHISSDMVMEVLQDPAVPVAPDVSVSTRGEMLKAGLIAAAGFAAVFAVLSYIKDTIKSEKDLEDKLDSVCLGELYSYGHRSITGKQKDKLLITELTAGFEFVERFKKLAARVSAEAEKHDAKVMLVTSVREHEGKTTVAANIALALAKKSDRVLLIDGDMRRPALSELFADEDVKLKGSLADVIRGRVEPDDAVHFDVVRGIYLLLNSKSVSNSTDLVSSESMVKLIERLRDEYEYVVIDTPPMSLMADAEVIADAADLSILTVKYDLVQARDLNDAIDALRSCRAHFAGCVLNDVKSMPGERKAVIGYGGYGRYGKYGRYGRYGRYGKYGKYGSYGSYGSYGTYGYYGHYGDDRQDGADTDAKE